MDAVHSGIDVIVLRILGLVRIRNATTLEFCVVDGQKGVAAPLPDWSISIQYMYYWLIFFVQANSLRYRRILHRAISSVG